MRESTFGWALALLFCAAFWWLVYKIIVAISTPGNPFHAVFHQIADFIDGGFLK